MKLRTRIILGFLMVILVPMLLLFCCVVWIQGDTAEKCPEGTDGSGI